ncbi:ankyrin repeat and IBR domain-containing protein 1-like, partial [Sinocyclocheilus grahami]|uniref:ankyrin repeat and IBR domain-containing protein 1-like n=1 Tax=Sinocyclocheilus grahami TaxID=75366 RepID=UPI0007ACD746
EYSDFQYRRRHRQRRRGDLLRLHSLRSNTPEPHDSNDNTLETHEGGNTSRHGIATELGSLDEDDPNILLAIQLSLQESGLALDPESQDVLSNDASVGASGSSLPSRLDSAPHTGDPPRASMSSSELLELGDSLMRLGNITSHYTPFNMNSYPDALGNAFTPSDPDCLDPSTNANLLGNIMAWFHDMNPQSIALIPSAAANASPELPVFGEGQSAPPKSEENEVGSPEQCSLSLMKESGDVLASQLLELECVDDAQPSKAEPDLEGSSGSVDLTSAVCPESSTDRDPQVTDLSFEWEEEVHLV